VLSTIKQGIGEMNEALVATKTTDKDSDVDIKEAPERCCKYR
jgi:hypothetical protein